MKLKELNTKNITFSLKIIGESSNIINIKYLNDELEFQTPKVEILTIQDNIIIVKLLHNNQIFIDKIKELERCYSSYTGTKINNLLTENVFKLKITHIPKVFNNSEMISYYSLKKGDVIICLVNSKHLWNDNNRTSYNLHIKEILVINQENQQ